MFFSFARAAREQLLPGLSRHPHPQGLYQQHSRSASKLDSTSRATSLSRVQIARIPSPPAHVKAQMLADEDRRASTRLSSKLPPSVMKMSSVMVSTRSEFIAIILFHFQFSIHGYVCWSMACWILYLLPVRCKVYYALGFICPYQNE